MVPRKRSSKKSSGPARPAAGTRRPGAAKAAAPPTTHASARVFGVVFEVGDLDEAARGWGALLADEGRRIPEGGGRHYIDLGPSILMLLDVSLRKREPRPNGSDLYVTVSSHALESYHARAASLGWLSRTDIHGQPAGAISVKPWGERSFYVEDPWHNGMCFIDENTRFTGR